MYSIHPFTILKGYYFIFYPLAFMLVYFKKFLESKVIARFILLLVLLSFSCSTNQVTIAFNDLEDSFSFNSDTRLTIILGDPHPDHLLIFSPEDYVYYFYETGNTCCEEIIFKRELVLDPLNFKGSRYDENTGEQVEEKVFSTPGKYILYFANNTETEPENTFFRERTITFR